MIYSIIYLNLRFLISDLLWSIILKNFIRDSSDDKLFYLNTDNKNCGRIKMKYPLWQRKELVKPRVNFMSSSYAFCPIYFLFFNYSTLTKHCISILQTAIFQRSSRIPPYRKQYHPERVVTLLLHSKIAKYSFV